jgi:hypothetical protein
LQNAKCPDIVQKNKNIMMKKKEEVVKAETFDAYILQELRN